jgi:hypothetical protein
MLGKISEPIARRLAAVSQRRRIRRAPFYRVYPHRSALALTICDVRGAIDRERRFFFNRIPKSANSTVSIQLAELKLGRTATEREAKRAFARPSELTAAEVAAFERFFKFTVVRNPYSRALSAYLDKIVSGRKLAYLRRAPGAAPLPSFADFCTYLDRGGLHENAHWAPQTSLMLIPIDRFDFMGRVETLSEDLKRILERVAPRGAVAGSDVASRRPRASASLAAHYDDRCAEIVRRLYRSDFEAFGYSERLGDARAEC